MTKITYLGESDDSNAPVTWLGHTFRPGDTIDVKHAHVITKARTNPFFDVDEVSEADEPELSTPRGKGLHAARNGKKRNVPPAYRGKSEAEEWLSGFDSVDTAACADGGGNISTGVQPGISLAP